MSQENVELVKALMPDEIDLVEVLKSDDPLAIFAGRPLESIEPDIEVIFEASYAGGPPLTFEGLGGLLEGWLDWLIPWETYRVKIDQIVDAGDDVVVPVTVRARTERHGVEVEHSPAAVWNVRGGRVTAVHFFLDRDHAFAFAGAK